MTCHHLVIARVAQRTTDLLAAAATARFEPARVAGSPVAVDVVWLITHKTVRVRCLTQSRSIRRTSCSHPKAF